MDRRHLHEAKEKLSLSRKDEWRIRRDRQKERRRYSLIAVISGLFAEFTGWLAGRQDERMVSRDTGNEYPFSSRGICSVGMVGSMITALSISSAYVLARRHSDLTPERRRSYFIAFLIAFVIVIFSVSYRLSQPVEYYSGAIDYGVFSQEAGGTNGAESSGRELCG